ncbi:MAG TPA: MFS transporter [Candidatus Acidoferrum sp.]|nr:MFS transporter [Candidatus Acidoferrum sp.]
MALTPPAKKSVIFFPVLLLFAINILNFYDRLILAALVEPMRREFHLNDTQIGLLGSVFIWLYAIMGVPLGRIADSGSRKKLLAWGLAVWACLTASAAIAANFSMLLFSRIGVGLGEAACAPTATSWLGDLFPPEKRSRVLALFMLGVPVGSALAAFFGGMIAQAYGWRATMALAGAPALLLVPALLTLEEPQRGASETNIAAPAGKSVWNVLRLPTFWWIIASGVFLNFNLYAISTFQQAFLSRVHGLSLAASGIAAGFVYLIGGVGGGLIAGYLGDFITLRRKDGRMLCAATAALLAVPFSSFGILQHAGSLYSTIAFLMLTYCALTSYYGFVYPAIQDIVAPNQRGTAMAIYFMAMYLCGASFGPVLTGHLSDRLAHRAAELAGSTVVTETFRAVGLQQAMLVIPILSAVLAGVLFMGSRTIASDMAQGEKQVLESAASGD